MPRLRLLSDLHLEHYEGTVADHIPPNGDAPGCVPADILVLAGDTDNGVAAVREAARLANGTPCVLVPGNHEFYGNTFNRLPDALRFRGAELGVHVLDRDAAVVGGVRFLGATLWTDFKLATNGGTIAGYRMNDYRAIRIAPEYRKLKPVDTQAHHAATVRWLREQLAVPFDGPTVIVTHHAPSIRSIAIHDLMDPLRAAYASPLDDLVETSGAALWVHGHTHHNVSYRIGSTPVRTNQAGYPHEPAAGFDPGLVLEV